MTTPKDVEFEVQRLKLEALLDALARMHAALREVDGTLEDMHAIRMMVGGKEGDGTSTVEHVAALVKERDRLRSKRRRRRT